MYAPKSYFLNSLLIFIVERECYLADNKIFWNYFIFGDAVGHQKSDVLVLEVVSEMFSVVTNDIV